MPDHSWQKNLAANFIAELLAMTAFSFIDPLLPLYIQHVGNLTTSQAAFWAGIATSGLGAAMFFISPVWGILADRFGRKPMVIRAMFGGAIILSLMSLTNNMYIIIVLRWMQGLITGSMAAMMALASSIVPRNRMSFAMGVIMLAIYSGQSLGPLGGGYIADHFGFHATFYASGVILLMAGLTVLFLVNERFERISQNRTSMKDMLRLALSPQMLPILVIMSLFSIGQASIQPIISLRIKQLLVRGDAATYAGLAFSLMGISSAISSAVSGRLGERINLKTILVFSAIIVGLIYIPPVWIGSVGLLIFFLILGGLLRGGLSTSINTFVGLAIPHGQQGIAYGLSQSASSLGNAIGPILGGTVGSKIGLRFSFSLPAGFFILAGITATRWLHPSSEKRQP